jgi:CRISPR-associated protein (TIGR03984 family)
MSQTLTPVYSIKKIASTSIPVGWEGTDGIAQQLSEGYIVLWQHHAIFTGVIEGGNTTWLNDSQPVSGDEHFVRVRAFNEAKEFHFWKTGGNIQGRLRTDAPGEDQEIIDASMMLRGVVGKLIQKPDADQKPAQLFSGAGHVVGKLIQKSDADLAVSDLAVVTRNYIAYDSTTQQAGYLDSRFVKFQPFNTKQP